MRAKDPIRKTLLEAALPHVPFDGWGDDTFRAAAADAGIDLQIARAACPRGGVDLAVAFHKQGDEVMVERLRPDDLSGMRFRDKIAYAVRLRLEAVGDKELVRRGSALFSLPNHAPEGAQLLWGTADAIWSALGDVSDDVNWYTKRATLSAVYGATALFWLGDSSEGDADTWSFLDRRIEDVMRIEKVKAEARKVPGMSRFLETMGSRIKAPKPGPLHDVPGRWDKPEDGE